MRYVRTKDKIYEVSEYNDYATHKRKGSTLVEKDRTSYIKNENIIAQSETLEELCDEFVLIEHYSDREDIHHHYRDKKSFIEDYIGYEHIDIVLRCYTIYGAIWTDKGLIYVAKMNDKGDLELI